MQPSSYCSGRLRSRHRTLTPSPAFVFDWDGPTRGARTRTWTKRSCSSRRCWTCGPDRSTPTTAVPWHTWTGAALETLTGPLADLTKAAEVAPRNAATYLNRAVAYMEGGTGDDLDRAIADLTRAMTLRATTPRVRHRAGAYVQRNALKTSTGPSRTWNVRCRSSPDLGPAYLTRGNAYLTQGGAGNLDLARQDFSRAIELAPYSPRAYYNRGLVHSALGDLDASVADLQRAHRLRPEEPSYNSTLCWQMGVSGKPAMALPYCDAAVAANVGPRRGTPVVSSTPRWDGTPTR